MIEKNAGYKITFFDIINFEFNIKLLDIYTVIYTFEFYTMPIRPIFSMKQEQSLGADVDIATQTPYSTVITGYNLPIALAAQDKNGCVLCIRNDSGDFILIDSDIALQGADTDQLRINNQQTAVLMYINDEDVTERYRMILSTGGVTLQ